MFVMEVVVNEWLLEYMRPESNKPDREKVIKLLEKIETGELTIVVRSPSAFTKKCHRYRKDFARYAYSSLVLKRFIAEVLQNSARCRFVNDKDVIPLDEASQKILSQGNLGSDTYLFEAANTTKRKEIITTDVKLVEAFAKNHSFKVTLLPDFNQLF